MNIGLMGNSIRPLIQQGMVYGYDIAVNELVDNIFKYSSFDSVLCFYEPEQFQQEILKRKARKIVRKDSSRCISMINEYDILFRDGTESLDIDVLHNVSSEFMPMIGLRENMKRRIPVTWTIHCASYPELLDKLFLPMVLAPVKSYDALICTSYAVKKAVESIIERIESYTGRKCRGNLIINPLGIDTDRFAPQNKEVLRAKYGIEKDAFVILWIGRFSAGDKADLYPLLKVFSSLIKENPGKCLKLLMAGYQPAGTKYVETLKNVVSEMGICENVIFMQDHNISTRHELYNISDVFTSPVDNVQETFGITPIEAMACGIPQVVSEWNGYKDTVVDGETGFLIKTYWADCFCDIDQRGYLPFDINHRTRMFHYLTSQSVAVDLEEYQKAFQRLIDDKTLYTYMSECSRKRALENYSWNKVIHNLENIWEGLRKKAEESDEGFEPDKILLPNYTKDFRSYPSDFIDERTYFKRTCNDDEIDKLIDALPQPYGVERVLNEAELLRTLLKNERLNMEIAVEENNGYSVGQVRRGIMYLYKYGLLKRDQGNV